MAKVHIPYSGVATNFGEKTALRIDPKNIEKMFYMITEAPYRDPLGTVIREYLSNAVDEHVNLDIDKPIEVNLPNNFEPNLTIRDYGRGMTREFVEEVFCSFGSTTKNESNKAIGGWGVGGKSFAALTDEILISTIKDGYKTIFVMYKDDKIALGYNILSHSKTDEANGTLVNISISDSLIKKCEKKVAYWTRYLTIPIKISPPLTRDFYPKLKDEDMLYNQDSWKLYNSKGSNYEESLLILIGGLPYPVDDPSSTLNIETYLSSEKYHKTFRSLLGSYFSRYKLLLNFEPGVLDLTVGREDLRYSDRTIKAIVGKIEEVIDYVRGDLLKLIEGCDNIWEASLQSTDIIKLFRVEYKGSELLDHSPKFKFIYRIYLSTSDSVLKRNRSYIPCSRENIIVYDDLLESNPDLSRSKYKKSLSSRLKRVYKETNDKSHPYCDKNLYFIDSDSDITDEWLEYLNPLKASALPEYQVTVSSSTTKSHTNKSTKVTPLSNVLSVQDNEIILREWKGSYIENSPLLWKYCSSIKLEKSKVEGLYLLCNRGNLVIPNIEENDLLNSILLTSNNYKVINNIMSFSKEVYDKRTLYLIRESDLKELNNSGAKLVSFIDFFNDSYAPLGKLRSLMVYINKFDCNTALDFVSSLGFLFEYYKDDNIQVPDWINFYALFAEAIKNMKHKSSSSNIIVLNSKDKSRERSARIIKIILERITKLCFLKVISYSDAYSYRNSFSFEKTIRSSSELKSFLSLINYDYENNVKGKNLPFNGDVDKVIDLLFETLNINETNKKYLLS